MRFFRSVTLFLVALALVMPGVISAQDPASDSEVAAWLDAHVIPLDTTEPDGGYADLMPLKNLVGGARIVALGEATHGTHEFFTMKQRMVEFLVKEMGFTIFAMETNWPAAERINYYVHTGRGDPAELLAGQGYWVWNTQEVLDLIEWVRAYNETAPKDAQVSFTGFDIWPIDMAVNNVLDYLREVDPDTVEIASADYACLDAHNLRGDPPVNDMLAYSELPLAESQLCGDSVRAVYERMVQSEHRYSALSGADAYAVALHNALIAVQGEEAVAGRYTSGPAPRDRFMAENVTWLLDQAGPDAKIILWAHNGHIMERGNNLGSNLIREYEDDYLTFGFAFDRGSFNAVVSREDQSEQYGDLMPVTVDPAPDGSIESFLRQATAPAYILDVRDIDYGEPGAKWLRSQRLIRSVGSVYNAAWADYFFSLTTLEITYDFVIFIEASTPSELLGQ